MIFVLQTLMSHQQKCYAKTEEQNNQRERRNESRKKRVKERKKGDSKNTKREKENEGKLNFKNGIM